MVTWEKQLHISLVSWTDAADRAFLFLDFLAILVEINDGVTVDDESTNLSIQMIDDDVALSLLNVL